MANPEEQSTTTPEVQAQVQPSSSSTVPSALFPKSYAFPPFFTLQPTVQTRHAQLVKWSLLTQRYCRHHRLWKLRLPDALATPLFHNQALNKRLSLRDARAVIDFMASSAEGDGRAEWITGTGTGGGGGEKVEAWIWWRRPEEWGALIAEWVEGTGQKGVVLTLYELVEGQETEGQEFWGLDPEVLRRGLASLVKKGRAQVFGAEDQMGVKFF
jgi:ESCRT-II complex subunit VPS25